VEAVSLSVQISATIKKYLKWYLLPFVYFLLTGLLCFHAWYTRPVPYRSGIKAVFKAISLAPTLILTGAVTIWIVAVIIFIPITFWLKKRYPKLYAFVEPESNAQQEDIPDAPASNKKSSSF